MLMMAWLGSYWFRCVLWSSSPSTPISAISLKIVANLGVEADMMRSTCFVVGIIGVGSVHLYFGFCHVRPLALQNHS